MFIKKNLPLIISSAICTIIVVIYFILGIQTWSNLQPNYIFLNVVLLILFLTPYGLSVWFTVENLRVKPLQFQNKKFRIFLIVVSVLSFLIFLFYFIYGLKGVCSLSQTIEEIKRGIVYSEVYTQEQLLSYESKLLARNIFAFVSTIVLFTNYVYQTIILFIRKLNNTSATTKSTFHNNWKSE